MSILDRIVSMVKGTANDTLDKMADPGRDARQIVRDMEEQIAQASSALLDAEAESELLRTKKECAEREVEKWTSAAQRAVDAGDDDLARECLLKVEESEAKAAGYAKTLDTFNATLQELQKRIADLRKQKDGLAQRTELIEARAHIAEAQETAASAIADIGNKRNLSADFQSLEDKVAKKEARAQAAARMADQTTGKSLEDRVDALKARSSVEDRLKALKEKKTEDA